MKSTMSGQKIPLYDRLLSLVKIFNAHRSGYFGNVESEINYHQELLKLVETQAGTPVDKAKILDLGCGQRAVQTVLFQADDADVIGIDMELPTYRMGVKNFINIVKTNGLERAVKSLIRHLLFDKGYYNDLCSKYGKKVSLERLDVRVMNAAELLFPDNYFDLIVSSAVFEHIEDVVRTVQEVNRVLKPSGIARIGIHLFSSLSGGHHIDWSDPDKMPSINVPPWDHLLENKFPVNTFLNKLQLDQFRQIFNVNMEIIHEEKRTEGEAILTPELEDILLNKGYSRDDLLTSTVLFSCRKKT